MTKVVFMKHILLSILFTLLTQLSHVHAAGGSGGTDGKSGGSGTGGGDEYTQDMVATASLEVAPWLVKNGNSLNPKVSAKDFANSINPKSLASVTHVYESCIVKVVNPKQNDQHLESVPQSPRDREVQICYNKDEDFYYINRALYPLSVQNSPTKRRNIAHEIFRRMNIEGDQYEVSKQISILNEPTPTTMLAEDSIVNTMLCARDIINKQLDGKEGIHKAASMLANIESNLGSTQNLAQIAAECKSIIRSVLASSTLSRNLQYGEIENLKTSARIRSILFGFVKPEVTCKEASLGASLAAVIAVGVKLGAAFCTSTNGRQWIEVSPGGAIGYGVTVEGDAGTRVRHSERLLSNLPISFSTSEKKVVSLIGGISNETSVSQRSLFDSGGPNGGVVGLFGAVLHFGQLNIEIVPLKTSRIYLYERFQSLGN